MKIRNILYEKKHKKKNLAEGGFDPPTFGLWAQHANRCATLLRISSNVLVAHTNLKAHLHIELLFHSYFNSKFSGL